MSEHIKTIYLFLLLHKWHVQDYWKETDGELAIRLAPPTPTVDPFVVRLTPNINGTGE